MKYTNYAAVAVLLASVVHASGSTPLNTSLVTGTTSLDKVTKFLKILSEKQAELTEAQTKITKNLAVETEIEQLNKELKNLGANKSSNETLLIGVDISKLNQEKEKIELKLKPYKEAESKLNEKNKKKSELSSELITDNANLPTITDKTSKEYTSLIDRIDNKKAELLSLNTDKTVDESFNAENSKSEVQADLAILIELDNKIEANKNLKRLEELPGLIKAAELKLNNNLVNETELLLTKLPDLFPKPIISNSQPGLNPTTNKVETPFYQTKLFIGLVSICGLAAVGGGSYYLYAGSTVDDTDL